ncbi:MAG TPA: vitamin B12-dependent ribonucleotide reductase, partial [Thermoplasmata archaeon]|nr:vitamin B12-dependent ribonucleotide reductase [Thermoplasmata archaeon]
PLQQLSACFVLPIEDSMEDIFEAIKQTALIHKSGGGTGFSFSRIRPKNDVVKTTKGVSSGPVSFMSVFDRATETIKQGGTRRGANMAVLRVDHPDILEFIDAKKDNDKLNNFNISVALTKEFMEALEKNTTYPLINPRTGKEVGRLKAKEVFDRIVKRAHANGEPGIIFLDRINEANPTPGVGEIESTNPCGEQPLLPYESCNLGSINLSHFVKDGEVDFERLRKTVRLAVEFLDNVIDVNQYPLPQIREMTLANRKIGLGVMGFANMLYKLNIAYDSDKAIKIAKKVMSFINEESKKMSEELAEVRGNFPNFHKSIYARKDSKYKKMRNATTTTIAPTGTLSIIAGTSGGIEPVFALVFERNVMDGTRLLEINPVFKKRIKEEGLYSEELMRKVMEKGSIQDMKEIPEHIRRVFVTAHDISPKWHVKMQAAFQEFTDNAVSKTVNFPNEATVEDVAEVYKLAYELGCKGITIYRSGSREEQVMRTLTEQKREKEARERALKPRKRPRVTKGSTIKMTTGCGNLYITINEDERGICEVFGMAGKAGGCAASQIEAVGRLISLALRSGIQVDAITKQLSGIRCPSPYLGIGGKILSCSDALAKALQLYLEERKTGEKILEEETTLDHFTEKEDSEKRSMNVVGVCPRCGQALIPMEGCATCLNCGYSKC